MLEATCIQNTVLVDKTMLTLDIAKSARREQSNEYLVGNWNTQPEREANNKATELVDMFPLKHVV